MLRRHPLRNAALAVTPAALVSLLVCLGPGSRAQDVDPRVLEAEAKRVAVIEKLKPTVVAVFARGGQGGGSGVLISADGYALTNFHVVAGLGPAMQCGLADGVLYDAVLVGLDKVGDVALIKLLPKKEGTPFPFAPLADSDKVKAGDWVLAMGNPFLLATDFTPTVTFGLVSGVHRYQHPEASRGLLEYTDCIQTDAAINPGNSGGPLYNLDGEVIGINGRISLERRGRVNAGVGYAISINQIKNFLGHLRAGLDTDHASTGFVVESESEDAANPRMLVTSVLEDCDANRRGIEPADELVSFAGRPMLNVNQYKNVLGLFPKGWRVPLVYRRNNDKHEVLVRLMGVMRQGGEAMPPVMPPEPREPRKPGEPRKPTKPPRPQKPLDSPALKLFEAKTGYANYYFNKLERDRLWTAFRKHGDFSGLGGAWTIEAVAEIKQRRTDARLTVREEPAGKDTRTLTTLTLGAVKYELDPLKAGQDAQALKDPRGSGGLLMALYQYRRLLTLGEKGFEGGFSHGGHEPLYPPRPDGQQPDSLNDLRVETAVLRTEHAAVPVKWYFSLADHKPLGFEATVESGDDPCEVYLADYKPVDGRELPHRIEVRYGTGRFGVFTVKGYDLAPAK
jgi:serine protease Do